MSEPTDIRAWQRLSDRITTSGRLLPGDPARLAGIGVRRIVNLALDSHPDALANEAEECAAAGLAYTHIPIPFDAPDDAHFAAFRAAIEGSAGAVHVHCIANWRVSACFYRYHRDCFAMPEADARALMIQQWEPELSDYPGAAAWASFIAAPCPDRDGRAGAMNAKLAGYMVAYLSLGAIFLANIVLRLVHAPLVSPASIQLAAVLAIALSVFIILVDKALLERSRALRGAMGVAGLVGLVSLAIGAGFI